MSLIEVGELQKLHAIEALLQEESKAIALLKQEGDQLFEQISENSPLINQDPLLARKFRTKCGALSIRLEKLLLDIDSVASHGNEQVRTTRKSCVKTAQELISKADIVLQGANRLIALQDEKLSVAAPSPPTSPSSNGSSEQEDEEMDDEEDEVESIPPPSAQPKVKLEENRLAYILTVSYPNAAQGEITLSKRGELEINLPGLTKPLKYTLTGVDLPRCSSRPNGPHALKIVLPKFDKFHAQRLRNLQHRRGMAHY